MEKRRLREVILDHIEAKDLKIIDVIEKTGIPEPYLDAILNDKRHKLPAYPYVRIYLVKIAELLGLNQADVIADYRREFGDKISGAADTLPANRFALPSSRKRYLIGGAVLALILLGYVISNSGFFGRPQLLLISPPQGGEEPYVVTSPTIELRGQIDSGDKLIINGQETPVGPGGVFSREYQLNPELNTIEFVVSRFLGKEIKVIRQVYYQVPTDVGAFEVEVASSTETE